MNFKVFVETTIYEPIIMLMRIAWWIQGTFYVYNGERLYYLFDKLFFTWISRLLRNHVISEPIITEMLIAYWRFQNRYISICLNVYGLCLCLKMLLTRNSKVLFKQTFISLKWCWYLLHNDVIKIRKIVFVWTLLVFI